MEPVAVSIMEAPVSHLVVSHAADCVGVSERLEDRAGQAKVLGR